MAQEPDRLIWIDMEMSGLNPDTDRILEVALVVTDGELNVVAESPVLVVFQAPEVLDHMDEWNTSMHGKNGLTEKVRTSQADEAEVERQMIEFLKPLVGERKSPMCGNSICQDRRFLARHMPALEAYFHYRNLDVSTLKELVKRWKPGIIGGIVKANKHTALADVYESIDELKYYRAHFIQA